MGAIRFTRGAAGRASRALRDGSIVSGIISAVATSRTEPLRCHHLPRAFHVRDAAVTDGPLLWLGKHFHL